MKHVATFTTEDFMVLGRILAAFINAAHENGDTPSVQYVTPVALKIHAILTQIEEESVYETHRPQDPTLN